jgi:hypothetical protein
VLSLPVFACTVLQDHTYYAPTAGEVERTIESTRYPDSVEGPPNVAVWSGDLVTLRLSFAQELFVVGMGPSKPVPMPVLPIWLLAWNGPGLIDPPMLFVTVQSDTEPVTIDFSEFRLFVPAHGGSEPPSAVQEINGEGHDSEWVDCESVQEMTPGAIRKFVLTYPAAGHVRELELQIAGMSSTVGEIREGKLRFERTHDAVLY